MEKHALALSSLYLDNNHIGPATCHALLCLTAGECKLKLLTMNQCGIRADSVPYIEALTTRPIARGLTLSMHFNDLPSIRALTGLRSYGFETTNYDPTVRGPLPCPPDPYPPETRRVVLTMNQYWVACDRCGAWRRSPVLYRETDSFICTAHGRSCDEAEDTVYPNEVTRRPRRYRRPTPVFSSPA